MGDYPGENDEEGEDFMKWKIGLESSLFRWLRVGKHTKRGEKVGLEGALIELMVEGWKTHSDVKKIGLKSAL